MLATLSDYKANLTLIQDSGIQFLDFGLLPGRALDPEGKFVRKTTNGPLLRLQHNPDNGRYLLPQSDTQAAEMVKPEYSYPLQQSLQLLNGVWLPMPWLRFNPPRTFVGGPDNWARMMLVALDEPDASGYTHRLCLAFDTRVYPQGHEYEGLALSESDVTNGTAFALAWRSDELIDFLDHTWVDGWLREVFSEQADTRESRAVVNVNAALREFEYQAHYLNLLHLIGNELRLPEIRINAASLQEPAVDVDLILDVGNSHTCGIMVEDHPEDHQGLKHSYELHLRNLSEPAQEYNELFESRVEFCEASFGKANFSLESGREGAFLWPSMVRVGREASHMALQRLGTDGTTGISSPRRYLWDEDPWVSGWRFSQKNGVSGQEPLAIAAPFTWLIDDEGQPLFRQPPEERLPVFNPTYSRSAIMSQMLSELLSQALMQMNSVAQRYRMLRSGAPRQLRHIILTLPSAMPKPEREIFRRRMQEAIGLVWKALGWHPQDASFSSAADLALSRVPVPDVQMEWDEATCGQMVYLYNETQVNFGGRAEAFFASMARPDRQREADEPLGKTLRIAMIDIGGGTTDLAITQYRLDDGQGNNVKIMPRLLFREGFKMAGDDILLDVIQLYVLPCLQHAFKQAGMINPEAVMTRLFGSEGRLDGHSTLRQQVTLQIFIPLGQAILEAYERYDPLDLTAEVDAPFGELLQQQPTSRLHDYINREIQRELPPDAAAFDILQVPLIMRLSKLHAEFVSPRMNITQSLRAMAEVVAVYDCDILLLTGRPSRFPGIQALFRHLQPLPVSRILSLDGYHTSDWYPFNKDGRIENPKSTAAVGAMLCLLSLDLRLGNFWFKAGDFQPYSTIRYLGMLDENQVMTDDNLWYSDIDLDDAKYALDAKARFQVRGNLCLGFRQLDNDRWPASPLYTLTIGDPLLARKIAGDSELRVRLAVSKTPQEFGPERFEIADALLEDGTRVPLEHLRLRLNTLTASSTGIAHYWIDSGSVYKK
ncbi:virulence factor SrfB [Izhakiella australiensis]|uniref:Virulence factor SrfB n=1 Tax=Izhakiella australiensis TaxID=1926881 RepID=A0A1S8YNX7_9GAMM|nr:virulence factor SrfB [Izhakiella australiensis]OON40343.1 virulence factor SrfB [Izhakiella australiensis]